MSVSASRDAPTKRPSATRSLAFAGLPNRLRSMDKAECRYTWGTACSRRTCYPGSYPVLAIRITMSELHLGHLAVEGDIGGA